MGREIKFRAWDGERMEFIDLYWFEENCVRDMADADNFGYTIMQYTGLRDVSGVEIYEGDIVRVDKEFLAEVVYSDRWTEFKIVGENSLGWYEQIEVFGNIYENPELLDD